MKESVIWFIWSAVWMMILMSESKPIKKSFENMWPIIATYFVMLLIMALYIGLPRSSSISLAICYGAAGGIIFESILSRYSERGVFDPLAVFLDKHWQMPILILVLMVIASWTFSVLQINERVLEFPKIEFLAKTKLAIQLFGVIMWLFIDVILMSIVFNWVEDRAMRYRDGYG